MIDIDLRAFLIANSDILTALPNAADAGVIQQNTIAETSPSTRIWYQRRGHETELANNGQPLLSETNFDLEVHSLDIDEAQEIAQAVKDALHGYSGLLGNTFALMVEVSDHDDSYIPKGPDVDEGQHIAALLIRIIS